LVWRWRVVEVGVPGEILERRRRFLERRGSGGAHPQPGRVEGEQVQLVREIRRAR